ncbi:MAG: hypothetical protein WDW38_009025 [Sanguina aurantia]
MQRSHSNLLALQDGAKQLAESLRTLVNDAVYLDEDSFSTASNVVQYQQRIQLQQRRMKELELEGLALRAEVEAKDVGLRSAAVAAQAAQMRVAELQQELENSAVTQQAHLEEILMRNDEIARLKAIIEGLGG